MYQLKPPSSVPCVTITTIRLEARLPIHAYSPTHNSIPPHSHPTTPTQPRPNPVRATSGSTLPSVNVRVQGAARTPGSALISPRPTSTATHFRYSRGDLANKELLSIDSNRTHPRDPTRYNGSSSTARFRPRPGPRAGRGMPFGCR